MKRWRITIISAALLSLALAACDKKKEAECPGYPPVLGGTCTEPGQTCEYSTTCGIIGCSCHDGNWGCSGGHYCPDADADGEVQPEAWDAEVDDTGEADTAEDVPQEPEEAPEIVEEDLSDEVECPGAPPVGGTCESPGVTCEYETTCGTMYCECIIGGMWNCMGGHDCPDEDGADGE